MSIPPDEYSDIVNVTLYGKENPVDCPGFDKGSSAKMTDDEKVELREALQQYRQQKRPIWKRILGII